MSHQAETEKLRGPLQTFLGALRERLTVLGSETATNHWMVRAYVSGICQFAARHTPDAIPEGLLTNGFVNFAPADYVSSDAVEQTHSAYLGQDFENYEVGRLFKDRRNYDDDHAGWTAAITEIRGRVWRLGWRTDRYSEVDQQISDPYTRRHEKGRIERYAKKYGWIGYYEKAGVLSDAGELPSSLRIGRCTPICDIDPSFPATPPNLQLDVPCWLGDENQDKKEWLASGKIDVPAELLFAKKVNDLDGPLSLIHI